MNTWVNYHSHTHYCDGATEPEAYVQEAIRQGFAAYGFSGHASVPFETGWCIPDGKLVAYLEEVEHLKRKYHDQIQIYSGLEIDYLPGQMEHLKHLLNGHSLDYSIHSIHFVDTFADGIRWNIDTSREDFDAGLKGIFNNDFRAANARFWELTRQMINEEKPQVIGHLDKIKMYNTNNCYFVESADWYQQEVENTLQVIKEADCIVEINTRGYYRYGQPDLYPGRTIVQCIAEMNIPVMINSDAHEPKDIAEGMPYAAAFLKELGIQEVMVLFDEQWKGCSFSEAGINF